MARVKKQAGTGPGDQLTGPRKPGSAWGPVKPIVPKAKKPTGVNNTLDLDRPLWGPHKGPSVKAVRAVRGDPTTFKLTPAGQQAYDHLISTMEKVDLKELDDVEERIPGDREKIIRVLEALALGARHREALGQVDWTWSHFTVYRARFPIINQFYTQVARLGEEMRKIQRLDEAHRRAVDGVEEPIYAPNGSYLGTKLKYSDTLLAMFLKADHPDKFIERHEVQQTGVVLNMHLGLREGVRTTSLEQGEIKVTSPFVEKAPDLPGGR